ncbi:hypothetical protein OIU84_027966 [Salix udensis]|uniref:Uncharacterized protein n=1 Tax=Salix udensis TaxID=889485 RepID=A0AAD6KC10_9ROSI|nr:hypothetical protein OIU84_027966 [Salix udensis]
MDASDDLTAGSGPGGSASCNPTARRHADDSTGDRVEDIHPTTRRADGSTDADLTVRRHAGDRAVSALSAVQIERLRRVHLSALLV